MSRPGIFMFISLFYSSLFSLLILFLSNLIPSHHEKFDYIGKQVGQATFHFSSFLRFCWISTSSLNSTPNYWSTLQVNLINSLHIPTNLTSLHSLHQFVLISFSISLTFSLDIVIYSFLHDSRFFSPLHQTPFPNLVSQFFLSRQYII